MGNPVILLQQICDQCVAIEDNGTIFLAKKDPEIRSTSNSTGQPVFPTGMEQALHSPPRSISPSPSPKINADNNMSRPSSPGSELDDYTSDHAGFHGKNTERLVKPKSVASPRQLHELEQENARLLEENGQLRSTLPVSIWSSRGNPTTSFSHSPPSVVGPSVLQTQYRSRGSPESLSPSSPFATTTFPESFPPTSTNYAPPSVVPTYPPVDPREAEILRLRKRVHELEQLTQRTEDKSLELGYTELIERFLFPTSTPAPATTGFQASWKARTDARIRQFCALNRAGNALCAWHDSRRERRVYPPRMAPDGYLNCGCTYEEALFEESLSRHGVGSYLPGDTVRMDPSLRNPLLKLLERRFGYKDGDFERDPHTGDWLPGEGPAVWEAQIQHDAGGPSRRARPAHRDWIPGASPTLWDAQIQAEALIKKEEANDSMEF
ncbi:hypothetical protein FB451DRAFT_458033 [Mycena latifolia]|nr:hypothetical protein FB451DRAFT_458033 [Mycena latifolia]